MNCLPRKSQASRTIALFTTQPGPLRDCLSQALLSEGSGMILIAREIALPAKQLNSYRLTPLLYGLATGDPLWLVTRLVRVNYHKA